MPGTDRREVYANPLNADAVEGALRVLKRVSVEALDADLARLVSGVEKHYREVRGEEEE